MNRITVFTVLFSLACFTSLVAAQGACPSAPGAERAACICKTVGTAYKYYADTGNGCSGASWCYGPGQSTYVTCQAGLLFNEKIQACDWASNVICTAPPSSSPTPSPSPITPQPSPGPSPSPSPSTASPSPSPAPSGGCTSSSYTQPGGACGSANGLCCPSSSCCSKYGYCGISDAHCGSGCQAGYGSCNSSGGSSTPSGPSPVPASPSPVPASPSPTPKSPSSSPSPTPVTPSPSPAPPSSSPQPPNTRASLPVGPLVVGYYQTWSAGWASTGANLDLARIPSYVNVVIVSFAKPDCSYTKGSFQLTGTGLDFSSDGTIVRDAITALKTANPNTRVLLAVGGATYYNFAGTRPQCIKDIIDDFGFDGMDFDWEPVNSNCVVKPGGGVSCATDAEGVSVLAALRAALPKGQYLMSTASWHVGMYGEGAFVSSKPASAYTGVNLAMAKSAAGQSLDLVNIMAYDAGNTASTGFDWSESYRAHRAIWQSQAIAVGVEIPPEAWGGNVITLPQVVERANYVKSSSTSGPYGIMLWSLHKTGCPNAQQITSAVCSTFGMAGCSTPLPFTQSACGNPPPAAPSPSPASPPANSPASPSPANPPPTTASPSPPPPPGNTGCSSGSYAQPGGACGSANGLCCPSGCCSKYGYCGISDAHCGSGCQAGYGSCSSSGGSSNPAPSPSPSPVSNPPSPAAPSPSPANPPPSPGNNTSSGTVADVISSSLFDQIFLHRNDPACSSNGFYTYSAFVAAAAAFPGFGTAADAATNKRELAAFLAQISHETTGGWATAPDGPYSWGLCWIQEGMKTPADHMAPYCAESAEYPCAPGKKYFGRGPMQLSWNYNYIPAGQALGFDGLNNPDAVTQDAVLAFKTAIWFWMTPRDPKPSCHAVMTGSWTPNPADMAVGRLPGFGLTTNIINGGLECSGTGTVQGQELDRIGYFKRYAALFGVDTGSNLDCSRQQHY